MTAGSQSDVVELSIFKNIRRDDRCGAEWRDWIAVVPTERYESGRRRLKNPSALRGFSGRRVIHRHLVIMDDAEELIGGYDPLVEEFER